MSKLWPDHDFEGECEVAYLILGWGVQKNKIKQFQPSYYVLELSKQ